MPHPTTERKRAARHLLSELQSQGPYVVAQIDRAAKAVHEYRQTMDKFTAALEALAQSYPTPRGRK